VCFRVSCKARAGVKCHVAEDNHTGPPPPRTAWAIRLGRVEQRTFGAKRPSHSTLLSSSFFPRRRRRRRTSKRGEDPEPPEHSLITHLHTLTAERYPTPCHGPSPRSLDEPSPPPPSPRSPLLPPPAPGPPSLRSTRHRPSYPTPRPIRPARTWVISQQARARTRSISSTRSLISYG
jgi:hypothetical protein